MFPTAVLWLSLAICTGGLPDVIKIGGIFEDNNDEQEMALHFAVNRVNSDPTVLPLSRIVVKSEKILPHSSFDALKTMCSMLEEGVVAMFGPSAIAASSLVESASRALHFPHLKSQWDFRDSLSQFSMNLYPHVVLLSRAYADLIQVKNWKSFAILYEHEEGLARLQHVLQLPNEGNTKIFLYHLSDSNNYKKLLKDINKSGVTNLLLDVSADKILEIMRQAQSVGMMTDYHNYLLTSLDFFTVDFSEFHRAKTNISAFRLVDPTHRYWSHSARDWIYENIHYGHLPYKQPVIKTISALTIDAVALFARSLQDLSREQPVNVRRVLCNSSMTWPYGENLVNHMKTTDFTGLSGPIGFDSNGNRVNFTLDIVEIKSREMVKVGTWTPDTGIMFARNYSREFLDVSSSLDNLTLHVTTILNNPYSMFRKDSNGGHLYEGFCVDLIKEICKLRGCKYKIRPVKDGKYGNKENGEWNGMIRELLDLEADLAIADLTITYEREEAVDFTMPFMNLGISILYKKPTKKEPGLFSFMAPFSLEVWVYMATAYLGVSLLLFIAARFTPVEWINPHSCNLHPLYVENKFNILNSFWFTIGSLMQQGSDLAPRAMSTRLIGAIWWFFTLIMISSYTANLAAFLTVARMRSPIEGAVDLAQQSDIKYGCVASGSTKSFFKESKIQPYKRMWSSMESSKPSVFTENNQMGLERVMKGNYAFLMESTTIEFITERNCQLTQIGGLLDSKGYGIAMPPGSPYRAAISSAILKLQEDGVLQVLKDKWWKMKERCSDDDKKSPAKASELGMANVGGVFVVLLVGLGLGIIIALIEFIWKTKKIPREERKTMIIEMLCEMKQILTCRGSMRPMPKYLDRSFMENGCFPMQSSTFTINTLGTQSTPS